MERSRYEPQLDWLWLVWWWWPSVLPLQATEDKKKWAMYIRRRTMTKEIEKEIKTKWVLTRVLSVTIPKENKRQYVSISSLVPIQTFGNGGINQSKRQYAPYPYHAAKWWPGKGTWRWTLRTGTLGHSDRRKVQPHPAPFPVPVHLPPLHLFRLISIMLYKDFKSQLNESSRID